MCKFCNLEALDADNFDRFFDDASVHGYNSMVCKHCSTTFLTGVLRVGGESEGPAGRGVDAGEENGVVVLQG